MTEPPNALAAGDLQLNLTCRNVCP